MTTGTHLFFADMERHAHSTFLAGDESILIIPTFSFRQPLQLLSRESVGPFIAGMQVMTPLWIALLLQDRHLCTIIPPAWMTIESLKLILSDEQSLNQFSTKLPTHYLELARALHHDDMEDKDSILLLLNDISAVRMDKIRTNLHALSAESLGTTTTLPIIDVTGISSLEMAAIQPLVVTLFGDCLHLARKDQTTQERPLTKATKSIDGVDQVDTTTNRLRRFRT